MWHETRQREWQVEAATGKNTEESVVSEGGHDGLLTSNTGGCKKDLIRDPILHKSIALAAHRKKNTRRHIKK